MNPTSAMITGDESDEIEALYGPIEEPDDEYAEASVDYLCGPTMTNPDP